ncbi:MAG: inositol monophosphatase [Phycisphaerae bacterium]|nr:inositol monophosphatase [Phycisphaerae bacterium]
MNHTDIRDMLETAVVASRLAGQRAMEEIRYVKSSIKDGREMVTQADGICQKIIIDRIKESYPDHGFLGEEGGSQGIFRQPPRGADDIWWVIDPIDGTNNYAHGLLCFAVSVAAFWKGKPIVAVIFDPATESMYTATEDTGAQRNDSEIRVNDEPLSRFSSFGIDSHFRSEMAGAIQRMIKNTRFRNLGATALHLAYVAKGSMIGTITTDAKLWDIAAGVFLIETAGGIVTDLQGKRIFPLDVAAYTGQTIVMISANRKNHPDLLKLFSSGS